MYSSMNVDNSIHLGNYYSNDILEYLFTPKSSVISFSSQSLSTFLPQPPENCSDYYSMVLALFEHHINGIT